jgi:hypothetical protein
LNGSLTTPASPDQLDVALYFGVPLGLALFPGARRMTENSRVEIRGGGFFDIAELVDDAARMSLGVPASRVALSPSAASLCGAASLRASIADALVQAHSRSPSQRDVRPMFEW